MIYAQTYKNLNTRPKNQVDNQLRFLYLDATRFFSFELSISRVSSETVTQFNIFAYFALKKRLLINKLEFSKIRNLFDLFSKDDKTRNHAL